MILAITDALLFFYASVFMCHEPDTPSQTPTTQLIMCNRTFISDTCDTYTRVPS